MSKILEVQLRDPVRIPYPGGFRVTNRVEATTHQITEEAELRRYRLVPKDHILGIQVTVPFENVAGVVEEVIGAPASIEPETPTVSPAELARGAGQSVSQVKRRR